VLVFYAVRSGGLKSIVYRKPWRLKSFIQQSYLVPWICFFRGIGSDCEVVKCVERGISKSVSRLRTTVTDLVLGGVKISNRAALSCDVGVPESVSRGLFVNTDDFSVRGVLLSMTAREWEESVAPWIFVAASAPLVNMSLLDSTASFVSSEMLQTNRWGT
jgi:hypothetical protein